MGITREGLYRDYMPSVICSTLAAQQKLWKKTEQWIDHCFSDRWWPTIKGGIIARPKQWGA